MYYSWAPGVAKNNKRTFIISRTIRRSNDSPLLNYARRPPRVDNNNIIAEINAFPGPGKLPTQSAFFVFTRARRTRSCRSGGRLFDSDVTRKPKTAKVTLPSTAPHSRTRTSRFQYATSGVLSRLASARPRVIVENRSRRYARFR